MQSVSYWRALVLSLFFILISEQSFAGHPDEHQLVGSKSTYLAILNANIYTVNRLAPRAQALLIRDGLIKQIGNNQQILNTVKDIGNIKQSVNIVDLGGKFLMPGFQDAHLHVAEAGFNEIMCVFDESLPSINDYQQQIEECAALSLAQGSPWILGAGISVSQMLSDTSQTPRVFLDTLFPDIPVLILDDLGHGAWVNSLAMNQAGYSIQAERQPQGGVLLRDKNGLATGEIFENAQQRVRDVAFQAVDPDQTLAYRGLLKGMTSMAENGITGISDAGGYWTRGDHHLWSRAAEEGRITLKAFNALYLFPDQDPQRQIKELKRLYSNQADQLIKFNTVKIYVDGILSLGTSALIDHYDNTAIKSLNYPNGFEYFKSKELKQYVRELIHAGFQLHFHVTGDRAARIALDAIESANKAIPSNNLRHRLSHAYLIDDLDLPRFKELGVIADFQLNPSSLDRRYYRPYLKHLIGSKRTKDLIPLRSALDAGAKVILSSDYDAGPLSPLGTIERALTRDDNPKQAINTIEKAIEMVTIDVAYALNDDQNTGSIEVGKQANLIVLDQDISKIEWKKIGSVQVESTMLGGKPVYDPKNNFQ